MSTDPMNKLDYGCHDRLRRPWTGMASIIVGFVCGLIAIAWALNNLHHSEVWDEYRVIARFPYYLYADMIWGGTLTCGIILFIQYPIYGAVIGIFAFCGYFRRGVILVLIIHIVAAVIAFAVR